jgi:hypothetical protein
LGEEGKKKVQEDFGFAFFFKKKKKEKRFRMHLCLISLDLSYTSLSSGYFLPPYPFIKNDVFIVEFKCIVITLLRKSSFSLFSGKHWL